MKCAGGRLARLAHVHLSTVQPLKNRYTSSQAAVLLDRRSILAQPRPLNLATIAPFDLILIPSKPFLRHVYVDEV